VYSVTLYTEWGIIVNKSVAVYVRVSTKDQSVDMQLNDLERYSRERELNVFKIYEDSGVSGTKETRPALNELMDDARKRKFDVVLVWRFDRFARSTKHLVTALYEFRNLGIDFISYQENIDTSSPLGEAIFTIISAMSKLERDIIAERVKGGLRKARANGKQLGRPKNIVDTEKVIEYRKQNKSIRQIAGEMNLSKGAVERTLKMRY
jgi:DNA invertase Pin-like site-specific DNA recombinase